MCLGSLLSKSNALAQTGHYQITPLSLFRVFTCDRAFFPCSAAVKTKFIKMLYVWKKHETFHA